MPRRRSVRGRDGVWAELECAFLNTYQARWQYVADALGFGFAQGKTMLWRRADLERAGGIETLAKEVAEDAASTKIVRDAGLKVRLVDRPFPPTARPSDRGRSVESAGALGAAAPRKLPCVFPAGSDVRRRAADDRARRRRTWPWAVPVLSVACASACSGTASETLLAAIAGWHLSRALPALLPRARPALPVLFVNALRGDDFVWRGNEMQVEHMRPRRVMAQMRPAFAEFAPVARRRLRSLRERMS